MMVHTIAVSATTLMFMKKEIDIAKYEDFIEAGFKECPGCGWAFDPAEYDRHNCDDMNKPSHNHIGGECKEDCPMSENAKCAK